MLIFGWDFEVDAWSRWNLIKICVMNSTLGSVVPLAMFCNSFMAQCFREFPLWPDVSRHLQLPHAVAPMGGGWKWARLSISQTWDYHHGLETHACHVYTIIWGYLSRRLDWPNGDEHWSIWSALSVFGGCCPSWRNIVRAGRALVDCPSQLICTWILICVPWQS